MELHVWSPVKEALSLDPDCLACIYLANASAADVTIVQSSNASLSPTARLPVLILADKTCITSFFDIAYYLADNQFSPADVALISYLQRLRKTAYDQLFQPDTYAAVRQQITSHTPFPLQYTVPLALKKQASEDAHLHRVEHVLRNVESVSKAKGVAVSAGQTEYLPWQLYLAAILIVLSLDLPGLQKNIDAEFPDFKALKEQVRAIRVTKPVQASGKVGTHAIRHALASII